MNKVEAKPIEGLLLKLSDPVITTKATRDGMALGRIPKVLELCPKGSSQ